MTIVNNGLTHVLGDTWDGVIHMAHGGASWAGALTDVCLTAGAGSP